MRIMDVTFESLVVADGQPHHLAVSGGIVYIDGERVTQSDMAVYDRQLSAEEIRRHSDSAGL